MLLPGGRVRGRWAKGALDPHVPFTLSGALALPIQPGDGLSAEVILDCGDSEWEGVRIRATLRLLGHR